MKIVTVEEIPELNLTQENWVQLVSRQSYGLGVIRTGEVGLFDLVKTSLRYRPDYIVVGRSEVKKLSFYSKPWRQDTAV